MRTPICDFVEKYAAEHPLRLHMPGHKGSGIPEKMDITEITGAGALYPASGIIRESEEEATRLFDSGRTFYSAEGSSLCIRAMLYLVRLYAEETGRPPVILAGRNAHRAFWTGAALLDFRVECLKGESLLTCRPTGEELAAALDGRTEKPAAVYLTSPDYLGYRGDVAGAAAVCRARGVPLLVDNAHGAYLKWIPGGQHPLEAGADLVCDSAHKTLPVLTGGAYLHAGRQAPALFRDQAERALGMFASTSPSWLILQSLDRCNALLGGELPARFRTMARETDAMKERLAAAGYRIANLGAAPEKTDPLKITIFPKERGYTGDELHALLRQGGMECEFSDPDCLVMMVSPATGREGLCRAEQALERIPPRAPIPERPPEIPPAERAFSLREAMLRPAEEVPVEQSLGRVLADACVSCPPAVPILTGGERMNEVALRCFRYYGISAVRCLR